MRAQSLTGIAAPSPFYMRCRIPQESSSMNEIKSGLPPANSGSYGSSPKRPTDGVETSGHLQTAHGEMTVVQIKATQMTSKPQVEHEDLSGSAVHHRIVTVAESSSPEQTAKDLKTIEEAGEFFRQVRADNPLEAVAALVEQLKAKGN